MGCVLTPTRRCVLQGHSAVEMLKELELCKRAEARLEQLIVEREIAEVSAAAQPLLSWLRNASALVVAVVVTAVFILSWHSDDGFCAGEHEVSEVCALGQAPQARTRCDTAHPYHHSQTMAALSLRVFAVSMLSRPCPQLSKPQAFDLNLDQLDIKCFLTTSNILSILGWWGRRQASQAEIPRDDREDGATD